MFPLISVCASISYHLFLYINAIILSVVRDVSVQFEEKSARFKSVAKLRRSDTVTASKVTSVLLSGIPLLLKRQKNGKQ